MIVNFIPHGLLQVDSELLPSGLLLSYEVYRGALRLDGDTIVNLELLENRDDGGRAGQDYSAVGVACDCAASCLWKYATSATLVSPSIICDSAHCLFVQALCLVTWIAVSRNTGNASLDGGFATHCKILVSSMTD
jgi:hypothetical protein